MSTPAQIAANRRNALKSTGPRTPEGKSKVRLNSLVHGLRSQEILLPGEDKQAFEDLRQAFLDKYQPEGPDELFCLEKMIEAYWRSRRIPQIESGLFQSRKSGLATAFTQDPSAWDGFSRLARYEASLDRAFYRAMNELRKLRAPSRRPGPEPAAEQQPSRNASASQEPPAAESLPPVPGIGFARQKDVPPPPPPKRYLVKDGKLIPIPAAPPQIHASDTETPPDTSNAMS